VRDAVAGLRATGAKAHGIACDVSREDQVRSALEEVAARGPIGFLFNVAGVGRFGPVEEITERMIDEVSAGNLKGLMLTTSAALPMLRSTGGTVVSVLSSAALVGRPDETVYCAAKWGARGFMEALRVAVRGSTVRTLTVYPGGMRTPFWSEESKRPSDLDAYMDPGDVARQIIGVVLDPRSAHVTELTISRP
jgi:NAD(P)-dependent dehydrogenase (short-subunit alcohol dehydrogenase family)